MRWPSASHICACKRRRRWELAALLKYNASQLNRVLWTEWQGSEPVALEFAATVSGVNDCTTFAAEHSGHYNCQMKGGKWKTISSERHFADRNLEVAMDRVQTPARPDPRAWTIVHRKPAVVIAAMTRDGKIVLIRQERIPIRQAIWEMPSGQIDNGLTGDAGPAHRTSKAIEEVALRELREEAGYELTQDGELIAFGYYFSSPGFTD